MSGAGAFLLAFLIKIVQFSGRSRCQVTIKYEQIMTFLIKPTLLPTRIYSMNKTKK